MLYASLLCTIILQVLSCFLIYKNLQNKLINIKIFPDKMFKIEYFSIPFLASASLVGSCPALLMPLYVYDFFECQFRNQAMQAGKRESQASIVFNYVSAPLTIIILGVIFIFQLILKIYNPYKTYNKVTQMSPSKKAKKESQKSSSLKVQQTTDINMLEHSQKPFYDVER